jgi:hypothetical protein
VNVADTAVSVLLTTHPSAELAIVPVPKLDPGSTHTSEPKYVLSVLPTTHPSAEFAIVPVPKLDPGSTHTPELTQIPPMLVRAAEPKANATELVTPVMSVVMPLFDVDESNESNTTVVAAQAGREHSIEASASTRILKLGKANRFVISGLLSFPSIQARFITALSTWCFGGACRGGT